jgi:hypothetical protein
MLSLYSIRISAEHAGIIVCPGVLFLSLDLCRLKVRTGARTVAPATGKLWSAL